MSFLEFNGISVTKSMLEIAPLSFQQCLESYVGGCMVSIFNVNNDVNNLPGWYQYCNTNQVLIFGEYHKMREYLYRCPIHYLSQYHPQLPLPYVLKKMNHMACHLCLVLHWLNL